MSSVSSCVPRIADVAIHSASDVRRAAEALRDIAMTMGQLRVAACANIASNEPMVDENGNILASSVFGWTAPHERWWENSRLALESPIPIACRYESEPFWCNQAGIRSRQPNPHLDAIDLSNFDKRAMTHAAIVVPVHLPFGQVGAVSFGPTDPSRTDLSSEYEEFADELGVYTRTFIAGYVKAVEQRRRLPSDCRLSKREVECLRWAALGKTDYEISLILARSCATIRFHTHNAAIKLDAVNRSQTVFKAAQLGYLGAAA